MAGFCLPNIVAKAILDSKDRSRSRSCVDVKLTPSVEFMLTSCLLLSTLFIHWR